MDSAPLSGRARLRFGRYDYAAFLTFAAYAASSLAIPVVLVDMAEDLHFPLQEGGMAAGGAFQVVRSLAMCASMVFAGFAAARWGNRRTLGFAIGTMGLGILLCALAPSYLLVLPVLLIAGLGEGVVEGLGTPFVQDMHRDDPGRYVNFSHGFWSLGTFAFALLAGAALVWNVGWRAILAAVGLVALLPVVLLFLPSRTPYPERAQADPPSRTWRRLVELLRTRRFWLFFAAMFLFAIILIFIQSLCVDRLPQLDSTLAFIVLSCAGVPGCGFFTWLMGLAGDRFGLARSFALVPVSYLVMVALVLAAAPAARTKEAPKSRSAS